MVLGCHSRAANRQCDPMTGSMSYKAFLRGEHFHAVLVGLSEVFKMHAVASLRRFAASLPSVRKTFTISIFKISKKPSLSPLALTIIEGQ